MTTPDDREFAQWHRVASEALIAAATHQHRVTEQLDAAQDYGTRALLAATNPRERMLALGLITTTCGIRVLHETGSCDAVAGAPTPPSVRVGLGTEQNGRAAPH